jgi:hypothetical protein
MSFSGNHYEEREKLLAKKVRIIEATGEIAKEMVEVFTRNTRPLARVKTGKWRDTIHGEATEKGPGIWDIWLGSHGAFSPEGFDYGGFWNFWDGTIDTGLFISQPEFDEIQKKRIDEAMQD